MNITKIVLISRKDSVDLAFLYTDLPSAFNLNPNPESLVLTVNLPPLISKEYLKTHFPNVEIQDER